MNRPKRAIGVARRHFVDLERDMDAAATSLRNGGWRTGALALGFIAIWAGLTAAGYLLLGVHEVRLLAVGALAGWLAYAMLRGARG